MFGEELIFNLLPCCCRFTIHQFEPNIAFQTNKDHELTGMDQTISTVFYKNLVSASELKPRKTQKTALTKH